MFVFIALGVLLPMMHQSSFGIVLLVMSTKLSPLWYTDWLPLLFVISAIADGLCGRDVRSDGCVHELRAALGACAVSKLSESSAG